MRKQIIFYCVATYFIAFVLSMSSCMQVKPQQKALALTKIIVR